MSPPFFFIRFKEASQVTESMQPPLDASEMNLQGKCVCVTGAGGYIGSHIVARLLKAGCCVHATSRSLKSLAHLSALAPTSEQLKLFEADLLQPHSFEEAIRGCTAVVHTASPYIINLPRGKEMEMVVDPAITGVRNVLHTAACCPSVDTVVLTSSTAACWTDPKELGPDHVFSEADWNKILEDPSAAGGPLAYFYAKAAAEKEAHAIAERSRFRFVAILPPAVYGPPLSSRVDSESVGQVLRMLNGRMAIFVPLLGAGSADVRDVAAAHCRALARPETRGRYLLNARSVYFLLLASRALAQLYPSKRLWLPFLVAPAWGAKLLGPLLGLPRAITDTHYARKPVINTSRAAQDLGMSSYIQPEQMVTDMAHAMEQQGLI